VDGLVRARSLLAVCSQKSDRPSSGPAAPQRPRHRAPPHHHRANHGSHGRGPPSLGVHFPRS